MAIARRLAADATNDHRKDITVTDPTFLIALAAAVLSAASIVLHVVAPRTKNTVDDAVRDDLDEVLAWWRGRQAGVVPGATKPAEAPRNPQAGKVDRCLLAQLGVLAAIVVVASIVFGGLACTAAQRTATGHAVVDCTAANAAAIGSTAAAMRAEKPDGCAVAGVTDWSCVEGRAIAAGLTIGGCAFLEVVTADKAPAAAAPTGPRPGRAAFESYRASVTGGAAFRTADGMR